MKRGTKSNQRGWSREIRNVVQSRPTLLGEVEAKHSAAIQVWAGRKKKRWLGEERKGLNEGVHGNRLLRVQNAGWGCSRRLT